MTRTSNTACSVIHLSSQNPHRLRCTQWNHILTHSKLRVLDKLSCCCCPLHLILLQVEADIRPFRGMLLGLFFVTTGSSLDLNLFFQQWPIVIALTGGLIATKIGIIGSVAQLFGLTKCAFHLRLSPPRVQHPCHVNLKYTDSLRLDSNVSAVPPEQCCTAFLVTTMRLPAIPYRSLVGDDLLHASAAMQG